MLFCIIERIDNGYLTIFLSVDNLLQDFTFEI
jgi:hypothetical protein